MNLFMGAIIVPGALALIRLAARCSRAGGRWLAAGLRDLWLRRRTSGSAIVRPVATPAPSPWGSNSDAGLDGIDAWTPAVRQDLWGRIRRDPSLLDPLVNLELAIAIERREIELARLKTERAGYRQAAKAGRPKRTPAAPVRAEPAITAANHLATLRAAAGLRPRPRPEAARRDALDLGVVAAASPSTGAESERSVRH